MESVLGSDRVCPYKVSCIEGCDPVATALGTDPKIYWPFPADDLMIERRV